MQIDESVNLNSEFIDCMLRVRRIDGRKNQLNLVRALKACSIPVVFVDQHAPNHSAYMQEIQREARPGMHALPSWYETPGLACLEAGAAGSNIVVTDRGSTCEYFRTHAYYCEPDSESSIRDAVLAAYHAPRNSKLQKLILENYTWAKAAEKTTETYEIVMGR